MRIQIFVLTFIYKQTDLDFILYISSHLKSFYIFYLLYIFLRPASHSKINSPYSFPWEHKHPQYIWNKTVANYSKYKFFVITQKLFNRNKLTNHFFLGKQHGVPGTNVCLGRMCAWDECVSGTNTSSTRYHKSAICRPIPSLDPKVHLERSSLDPPHTGNVQHFPPIFPPKFCIMEVVTYSMLDN